MLHGEAIRPLPIEEKRLIQMGVAHIDKTRCIAWDTEKICLVCNEQCSYHAIIGDDKKRPIVKEEKCTGCGMCAVVCPHAVFVMDDRRARLTDRDFCMECGACQRNCPFEAIAVRAGVGCAWALMRSQFRGEEVRCADSG